VGDESSCVLEFRKEVVVRKEDAFDRTLEDDHFEVRVGFNRGDDLTQLRNGIRTKDIERRMIKRYSPIVL